MSDAVAGEIGRTGHRRHVALKALARPLLFRLRGFLQHEMLAEFGTMHGRVLALQEDVRRLNAAQDAMRRALEGAERRHDALLGALERLHSELEKLHRLDRTVDSVEAGLVTLALLGDPALPEAQQPLQAAA